MIEHTFWKAMSCVFDWIRENRMAEIQQFTTIISKAIENDGFRFTSMEEALILYKKLSHFDYHDIFWTENYYYTMQRKLKKYIFEKVKHKVKSEIRTKMGIVESSHELVQESIESIESIASIASIESSIEKLEIDVLEEYLHNLLEFSPYTNGTDECDDYEFQLTSEHDIFFRTLARVVEAKWREIL